MRFYTIFLAIIVFSGCSSTISGLKRGIDGSIPTLTKISTLSDVSSIAFEWSIVDNPNVTGYVIYRSKDNKNFKEIKYIPDPNITHFVDVGLIPETEYQYYFITIGTNSYSNRSKIIKIKTSFIDAIENLYASNDYAKSVKLIWTPHFNPSVSEYLIQKEIGNTFKTISHVTNRLMVEYFDKDLEDGKVYKYRVIARDFLGNPSRPSKIVLAKTKEKPDSIHTIKATENLVNNIVVSWDNSTQAKAYKIYKSNAENGVYKQIGKVDKNQFVDNINKSGAVFYYKVSLLDSNDIESVLSNPIRGATRNKPKQPIILKGYVSANNAKIEWEKDDYAKYFIINRKQGIFGKIQKFRTKENSFNDKDVKIGKDYKYSIIAVDSSGLESIPSEEVSLSIK